MSIRGRAALGRTAAAFRACADRTAPTVSGKRPRPCIRAAEGFSLLEVVVVMAIVAILTGIMVPFAYRIWESADIELTRERMRDVKNAMTGDPRMIQNGIRTSYGYVGDHGELPASLADLNPSYLPSGFDPAKYNKDAWQREFVYGATVTGGRRVTATVASKGPDGQLGTSDDINDTTDPAVCRIRESEVTPTAAVSGNLNFVFLNASALPVTPVYSSLVTAAYAAPGGTVSASTACIGLGIGLIAPGGTKNLTQSFSSVFPEKLPIGKSEFRASLYQNGFCSGSSVQGTGAMAVFIHDGLNMIYVNLPVISHTVTGP